MGLDPGERRIGIAVSDELGLIARPLEVIHRRSWQKDLQRIRELASAHGVGRIIIGWPLTLSGERGPAALWSEHFAERLREALDQPVELWDERFSTAEARRYQSLRERRRGSPVDAVAAAVMLQHYLDGRR